MTEAAAEPELCSGKVIAGRFRLERLIGKGGMGSVWVARHLSLNVEVALKFIDMSAAKRRSDVASRFEQEAQAAARVKGPHVVNILDYGSDEAGRAYIAMELLQGEELAKRIERDAQLPLDEVCRVVSHACRGLGRAHAAGIVHRDLKPENLFLVDDDDGVVVKVLDFGIAKASSPVGEVTPRTDTGQILGTPLYMSPEQALGTSDVDFRSDLYSLAVVAFRCLTGVVPFYSKALGQLIVKVSTEPVPSARALRPDLPPSLDAWFGRAMHKDPAQRFASAREMAEQFSLACGLTSTPAPPPSRASAEEPPPSTVRGPDQPTVAVQPAAIAFGPASSPSPLVAGPAPSPSPPDASGPSSAPPPSVASAPPRRAAAPPDAPSLLRPTETLMDAAATYTPPSPRPLFNVVAAAGLMVFLVGSIITLATRPFGHSGPFSSRPERVMQSAMGAGAAQPIVTAQAPAPEAPRPAASAAPAKPKRPAPSSAPAKPKPPPDAPPRRRAVEKPAAEAAGERTPQAKPTSEAAGERTPQAPAPSSRPPAGAAEEPRDLDGEPI